MICFARMLPAALFALFGTLALLTAGPAYSENPPKRIYIVQSYEAGHVCGEPQAEGELQSLAVGGWTVGRNLEVKTYYMDTYKTNTSPESMHLEGQKALQEISEFKPDLVFVNDDAAVAQVMMPLVGGNIPLVFSGMNGQPEMYNERKHYMENWAHPGSNVTGVYEKLYAAQAVKVMEQAVPGLRGAKIVMITDYTPTGNGLTKQFELELKNVTDGHWEVQLVQKW
jgi:putative tryptophan/tyrosine transport system substrate-binding protein